MKEWMTIDDLTDYLQVSQTKIRHLIKQGQIPFHSKLGSPRFFKPEIDDWMMTETNGNEESSNKEQDFKYRGTAIKEYMLTASKILIGQTALNRWPEFIKKAVAASKKSNRSFLYRKEFQPLIQNFNDYLRLSCQVGLIDNRKEEEREKHYYPTEYAERIYLEKDAEKIKEIILESILDLVRRKLETIPQERHAIFLLWYLLKLREKGLDPQESHFDKGGEANFFPRIRLNFSLSLCDFLFGGDRTKEQEFLERWEKHVKN